MRIFRLLKIPKAQMFPVCFVWFNTIGWLEWECICTLRTLSLSLLFFGTLFVVIRGMSKPSPEWPTRSYWNTIQHKDCLTTIEISSGHTNHWKLVQNVLKKKPKLSCSQESGVTQNSPTLINHSEPRFLSLSLRDPDKFIWAHLVFGPWQHLHTSAWPHIGTRYKSSCFVITHLMYITKCNKNEVRLVRKSWYECVSVGCSVSDQTE